MNDSVHQKFLIVNKPGSPNRKKQVQVLITTPVPLIQKRVNYRAKRDYESFENYKEMRRSLSKTRNQGTIRKINKGIQRQLSSSPIEVRSLKILKGLLEPPQEQRANSCKCKECDNVNPRQKKKKRQINIEEEKFIGVLENLVMELQPAQDISIQSIYSSSIYIKNQHKFNRDNHVRKISTFSTVSFFPPIPVAEIKVKPIKQYSVKRSYKTDLYVRSSSQKTMEKFLNDKLKNNTNEQNESIQKIKTFTKEVKNSSPLQSYRRTPHTQSTIKLTRNGSQGELITKQFNDSQISSRWIGTRDQILKTYVEYKAPDFYHKKKSLILLNKKNFPPISSPLKAHRSQSNLCSSDERNQKITSTLQDSRVPSKERNYYAKTFNLID